MSIGRLWFERPVPPDVAELLEGTVEILGPDESDLATANGAIVGSGVWDSARFEITPELKVASRTGIGIDKMDLDAATRHGVMVTNTPDGPTISTAEHALALLLAVAKRLPAAQRRLREGERTTVTGHGATELDGLTLGLVGYGRIGRRVARVARALGMQVAVFDPYAVVDDADQAGSVPELFARSHAVSLHLPLTPETNQVINAEVLAHARPGTLLVNTARGGLVDQDALMDALDDGRLAGAGLDVTDPEPLAPDHPLLHRDDVIVTPHIASSTIVGTRRLLDMAIEQALMALRGERPTHLVNQEVAPT